MEFGRYHLFRRIAVVAVAVVLGLGVSVAPATPPVPRWTASTPTWRQLRIRGGRRRPGTAAPDTSPRIHI